MKPLLTPFMSNQLPLQSKLTNLPLEIIKKVFQQDAAKPNMTTE
jgi:hypothetical protein